LKRRLGGSRETGVMKPPPADDRYWWVPLAIVATLALLGFVIDRMFLD
jgi:hypothetical protein